MNNPVAMDRCFAFINCQLKPGGRTAPGETRAVRRAVTLSRQAGCGALVVAEKLAALLQADTPAGEPPWTVFDRNLMEKVLEEHNLPARLARFLPEDRITLLQDIADELFGLRPATWTMIEQTADTVLRLAELGHVILIGRGAHVITARLPHVLHVRLVAPLEKRLEQCRRSYGMSEREARAFCVREDKGRERYLKKHFNADVNDPLLYHLIINTGLISFDEAARLIADALKDNAEVNGKQSTSSRANRDRD
jgi:cytidylate kinase